MWRFWFKFHNVWTWRNPELFEVTLHAGLFEDLVEVIWCEALSATMSRSIWSHSRGRGAQILIEVPTMSRGCLRCLIAYVALVGRHWVRSLPVPGDAGYEHKMLEGAVVVWGSPLYQGGIGSWSFVRNLEVDNQLKELWCYLRGAKGYVAWLFKTVSCVNVNLSCHLDTQFIWKYKLTRQATGRRLE